MHSRSFRSTLKLALGVRGLWYLVSHGRVLGGEGGKESNACGRKGAEILSEKQRGSVLWAGTHSVSLRKHLQRAGGARVHIDL